ncbi:hypothetical protein D6D13_01030 [Aureobasidium pullulans]|uniref:DUF7605 domain-containing protein n=1 Tax=Aureobasidium pullulans TaxID=5580 RepID=A0A4S9DBT4_AURPU|nr:hypothetical protein D6D13_01030 [Aureobasidium pullulans]
MSSRSASPEANERLLGKRKRTVEDEDNEGDSQTDKRRHMEDDDLKSTDDFDVSKDLDDELLFVKKDREGSTKTLDLEPEQGTIRWSEDREEYPNCAVYHADVKQYQARVTELFVNLAEHLSRISHTGDDMEILHTQAIAIQTFSGPKRQVVALAGDAGSGKSSLISSILDIPHISRHVWMLPVSCPNCMMLIYIQGNYGRACTCAITEYTKAFPDQTRKFSAQIVYLNPVQLRKLLVDHLKEYVIFHFEKDKDWTVEETAEYRAQAQTAEGTLLDLFRDKPSFNNSTEMKSYIHTSYKNKAGIELAAQLYTWCQELVTAHNPSSQLNTIEADRAFQLNKALSPFLSSGGSSDTKPRLWPLVFKVSIGVRGCRVLENLTIADLPVRVKASKNYIRSSDYLWIVAPIGRCVTDTTVDTILFEFGERFAGRLAIICTKIDDKMTSGMFMQEYQTEVQNMEKIERAFKEAKEDLSKAKALFRQASKPSTIEERNKEVEVCQERYGKLANIRLRFMVRTRNRKIADMIYEDKSEYLEEGVNGPVFFVSNEHYMWLKGYKESETEAPEQLDAYATGIPGLRTYALSIPAQEMWLTFLSHIRHTSIGFTKALRIWATKTGADDGDGLLRIKEKSLKAVDQAIEAYLKVVAKDAVQSLAVPIRVSLPTVAQKGYEFMQDVVGKWHHSTIKAFVSNDGSHSTKKVGHVDWNAKLRRPAVRLMSAGWDEMSTKEKQHLAVAQLKLQNNMDVLQHDLKEMMELFKIPRGHFEELLDAQKHGIARAGQRYCVNLDKEFRNTKQLTEKDNQDGYFVQAMSPVYTKAAKVNGKGSKDKIMNLLEEYVNQRDENSPFIRMADYASKKIAEHSKTFSRALHEDCNKIYNEVFNQFGGLMIESADDNAAVVEVKSTLREFLPEVDNELAEIVKKLEDIERNPRSKGKQKSSAPDATNVKQEKRKPADGASTTPKVKIEIKKEQQ